MSKSLALIFSVTAIIFLVGIGIALSYRLPWLALLLAMLWVVQVGLGFVVKAKKHKKSLS